MVNGLCIVRHVYEALDDAAFVQAEVGDDSSTVKWVSADIHIGAHTLYLDASGRYFASLLPLS
jgi:hypothetical protein